MNVKTRSERVERSRRTIVELLGSRSIYRKRRRSSIWRSIITPISIASRASAVNAASVIDDNPMYIRDYEKCILCWRCVQVCADDAQYAFAINFSGRGFETSIGTFFDKAHAGNDLRVLRAMRGRVPHRRAEAET